jgi:endonuclease III
MRCRELPEVMDSVFHPPKPATSAMPNYPALLIGERESKVEDDQENLITLQGVRRQTAHVILLA